MAIARPTFQQRLFSDDELPLQAHDRIVRWADTTLRSNPSPFLRELEIDHEVTGDGCVGWDETRISDYDVSENDESASLLRRAAVKHYPTLPPAPKIETLGIGWEPILKDERGTIVGAVDLTALIRVKTPEIIVPMEKLGWHQRQIEEAFQAFLPDNVNIGYFDGSKLWVDGKIVRRDMHIDDFPTDAIGCAISRKSVRFLSKVYVSKYVSNKDTRIYVEIKTKIRSAGELLRQINLYRMTASRGSKFLVVAPADAWEPDIKNILREQGVGAVDYLSN